MEVESSITSKEFYIPEVVWVASGGISNQGFHMFSEKKNAFAGTTLLTYLNTFFNTSLWRVVRICYEELTYKNLLCEI